MKKIRKTGKLVCLLLCGIMLLTSCATDPGDESKAPSEPVSESTSIPSESSSEVSEPSSEPSSEEPSIEEPSSEEPSQPEPEPEFIPVFRIAVCSDTHISATSSTEAQRLKKLFTSTYKYAESNEHYKLLDAVLVAGDLTNSGYNNELVAFEKTVESVIKEETTLVTIMGNHEFYGGGIAPYKEVLDQNLNKDVVIKGFHIIGLSPDNGESFNNSKKWLEDTLAAAAAEDPEKPIFTMQHHHLKDTVYVSAEWYTSSSAMLSSAYGKYSQVVNFSGHSHGPVNNPTSLWQGDFTALGTGTLSYFEMTSGMTYGTLPPNKEKAAQFYIIEVDADNKVKIMPYDILTDDFFKTPSDLDGDAQLVYYIDTPSDKSTFRYTDRASESADPFFAEGSKVTLSNATQNSVKVAFPQASDDDCVYSYSIECTPVGGGTALKFAYFSEYYFEPMPESLSYTLSGFKSGTEYKVSVFPVDCFGKKGKAIEATFTTEKAEEIVYKSDNKVTFLGTFTDFNSLAELRISNKTFAYGGTPNGDVFVGDWQSAALSSNSKAALSANKGYKGTAALEVWSTSSDNQGLYIFADSTNKFTTKFPEPAYLRVWVDFTDISFRKANFGLLSPEGALFTTDECDGRTDLSFWYMADGTDKWVEMKHGDDGCFGTEQSSSVAGFKGWMAFPVKDFTYRSGTGKTAEASGVSYHSNTIAGVYMFWDYASAANKKFYLDEIQLVTDYTVFENYANG